MNECGIQFYEKKTKFYFYSPRLRLYYDASHTGGT